MLRIAAFALMVLTSPAAATQDRWPALFDVSGVAADDVLNIRAAPDAGAPILGTLAPDAVAIEVVASGPAGRWGAINLGERTGWASLRYLSRQPGQWLGAPIPAARCIGTEPDWSFVFSGASVLRSAPGETRNGDLDRPESRHLDPLAESLLYTLEDGTSGAAVLQLRSCSDGMSDTRFGIAITLIEGLDTPAEAESLSGCCSLQTDPASP